jgi:hypothetical protein
MSNKTSSRVFKSFFDNYYNWENSRFRECVDYFLYELAGNMKAYSFGFNNYTWDVQYMDKSDIEEMVRVLRILQPSLDVSFSNYSRRVELGWVGRFNVPAQYFKELQIVNPAFPPVVRLASAVRAKSNIAKNPWTGRLRAIKRVNYCEEK